MPLPITEVALSVALGAAVSGPETMALRVRVVTLSAAPQAKVDVAVNAPGVALETVTVYWPVLGAATMVKGVPPATSSVLPADGTGVVKVQAMGPAAFWVDTVCAAGAGAGWTPTAGNVTTLGVTKTEFDSSAATKT